MSTSGRKAPWTGNSSAAVAATLAGAAAQDRPYARGQAVYLAPDIAAAAIRDQVP